MPRKLVFFPMCHLVCFHLDYALFTSSSRVTPTAQFCSYFKVFVMLVTWNRSRGLTLRGRRIQSNVDRSVQKAPRVTEFLAEKRSTCTIRYITEKRQSVQAYYMWCLVNGSNRNKLLTWSPGNGTKRACRKNTK